jgi:hypothetical protein
LIRVCAQCSTSRLMLPRRGEGGATAEDRRGKK